MLQYLPKVRYTTYVVFFLAWHLKVSAQKMHSLMDCTENAELPSVRLSRVCSNCPFEFFYQILINAFFFTLNVR